MIQGNGWRFWLGWLFVLFLLSSLGLGWLVRGLSLLMLLVILTPTLLTLGLRWWLSRNLVTGACPVCGFGVQGVTHTPTQCPHCGERLQVTGGQFVRFTPPGIVDVSAVEVPESKN
ncbi:hypothetical protein GlitD10_0702 [Gloeomargarita lithophora Alchichica-D10]|uniref:Uncharacterized protein n=1 Tax=Gloeomargarita lithophora Alchichica-D10 TaxID=1188229 RepID=A0A1J0AAQ5_9CYAN|nr:hypothetical protein [Gloeomargarita lithophora]APB33016.1 hypothetical protein GlitD10_0702 [Gloeomargarita lithophora Alchichica-D10]